MNAVLAPPLPTVAAALHLLTAEEFMAEYSHRHAELVRGTILELPMPSARHGEVCVNAVVHIANFVKAHKLGRVCSNDSLIVTRRNPDSARGPDVSYYSFARMPAGPAPQGICEIAPELAVEVRSPSNSWAEIFAKIGEYLQVGVTAVLVLDPERTSATVYRATGQTAFGAAETLTVPEVLPGFEVIVGKFFE